MLLEKDHQFLANYSGKPYTKLIALMCKECIYDPEAKGTWRKQVEKCTCTECPLYKVRPKTT